VQFSLLDEGTSVIVFRPYLELICEDLFIDSVAPSFTECEQAYNHFCWPVLLLFVAYVHLSGVKQSTLADMLAVLLCAVNSYNVGLCCSWVQVAISSEGFRFANLICPPHRLPALLALPFARLVRTTWMHLVVGVSL
jgi:hypothetical protein